MLRLDIGKSSGAPAEINAANGAAGPESLLLPALDEIPHFLHGRLDPFQIAAASFRCLDVDSAQDDEDVANVVNAFPIGFVSIERRERCVDFAESVLHSFRECANRRARDSSETRHFSGDGFEWERFSAFGFRGGLFHDEICRKTEGARLAVKDANVPIVRRSDSRRPRSLFTRGAGAGGAARGLRRRGRWWPAQG
jgi:hypothetical protein